MQFPEVDNGALLKMLGEEEDRFKARKFFKFPSGKATSFYILPPKTAGSDLFRRVSEAYLKLIRKNHVAFETYEIFRPGFGASDPVVAVLREFWRSHQSIVKEMMPRARFHAAILVDGYMDLDQGGNALPNTFKRTSNDEALQIVGFSQTVFKELVKSLCQPCMKGSTNPTTAVPILLTVTGSGLDTEYKLRVAGNQVPGAEFQPYRCDLTSPKARGMDFITKTMGELPDLKSRWPMPGEDEIVRAKALADELREAILSRVMGGAGGPPSGPSGSVEIGSGPPSPAGWEIPSPPSIQTGAPPPAVATKLATMDDAKSRCLGTQTPPQKDSKSAPICFQRYGEIQGSPNAAWCSHCTWLTPCKVGSPPAQTVN